MTFSFVSDKTIIQVYTQGKTLIQTAKETGVSRTTVRERLLKHPGVLRPKIFKYHCVDCGKVLKRSRGSKPKNRCVSCGVRYAQKKRWGPINA